MGGQYEHFTQKSTGFINNLPTFINKTVLF